ncbi:MAG TPA: hypothetical protein PLL62_02595 [Candidatus Saccharicenans sp.]|nr:hypothetical protein [Candidatus Saccharicenans sp.]HQM74112.1 hypothetical protein [Candidatus Saccharicenans sp.]
MNNSRHSARATSHEYSRGGADLTPLKIEAIVTRWWSFNYRLLDWPGYFLMAGVIESFFATGSGEARHQISTGI